MKKKARSRRSGFDRASFERRLVSYGLASGALLASGAIAQADVIVWDSSNSGLPQGTGSNGSISFDLLTGSVGGGTQFRIFNSNSYTNGTRTTQSVTHSYVYYYTTSGSTTVRHTNTYTNTHTNFFPYHRERNSAYGSRYVTGAYFRGNSYLDRINAGSTVGPGSFTGSGRLGRHQSYNGGTGSTYYSNNGNWSRNDHAYLGLRFSDGSGNHFGWAEISTGSQYEVTLIRMAYETIPDQALNAGQTVDALSIMSVVSRKNHGGQDFDIPLPLTGDPGVECRAPGSSAPTKSRPNGTSFGQHTLIVKFTNRMTGGDAVITDGTGNIDQVFFPGDETMEIQLGGVINAQRITVKLTGVTDHNSQVLGDTEVSMDVLLADTTASREVNSSDVSQTQAQSGSALTNGSFREDVTVDGSIDSSDVSQVQAQSGTAIPDPAPPRPKDGKTGRAIVSTKDTQKRQ